jgi:hypothetical protein
MPNQLLDKAREEEKKPKTGHTSKLVFKQQTEGAAIKTERAVPGGGGYIYRDREIERQEPHVRCPHTHMCA